MDTLTPWRLALRQVRIFAAATPEQLDAIGGLCTHLEVPEGACLCEEGRPVSESFIVVDGVAVISHKGLTVAKVVAGSLLGELSPLVGGQSNVTVTARTRLEVLSIPTDELLRILDELPGVGNAAASLVAASDPNGPAA